MVHGSLVEENRPGGVRRALHKNLLQGTTCLCNQKRQVYHVLKRVEKRFEHLNILSVYNKEEKKQHTVLTQRNVS